MNMSSHIKHMIKIAPVAVTVILVIVVVVAVVVVVVVIVVVLINSSYQNVKITMQHQT